MLIFPEIEARLARAEEHVKNLDRELNAFTRSEAHIGVVEKNNDGTEVYLKAEFSPKFDAIRCGILLGEIIHQSRSALDNVVNRLVEECGGTPTTKTCYPIFSNRRKYRKAAPEALHGLRPDIVAAIERMQPFNTGGDRAKHELIWLIHDLDVMDKHKIVMPVILNLGHCSGRAPKGCSVIVPNTIEDGAPLVIQKSIKPMDEMCVKFDMGFNIAVQIGKDRLNVDDVLNKVVHQTRLITNHLSKLV